MTDTVASQNIDLSSWDILYIRVVATELQMINWVDYIPDSKQRPYSDNEATNAK